MQAISISRGAEDDASFASLGARQALEAAGPYTVVVSGELLAAVRALRGRGVTAPVADLLAQCSALAEDTADRDLTADLVLAGELLVGLA